MEWAFWSLIALVGVAVLYYWTLAVYAAGKAAAIAVWFDPEEEENE